MFPETSETRLHIGPVWFFGRRRSPSQSSSRNGRERLNYQQDILRLPRLLPHRIFSALSTPVDESGSRTPDCFTVVTRQGQPDKFADNIRLLRLKYLHGFSVHLSVLARFCSLRASGSFPSVGQRVRFPSPAPDSKGITFDFSAAQFYCCFAICVTPRFFGPTSSG
jgi:hypothetical protein